MFQIFKNLIGILDSREQKLAFLVLLLTIAVSFIEVLGVASIMPFMAVMANPSVIETNPLLSSIYIYLDFQSTETYLFFIGVCVLVLLVGSTLLKALVVWAQTYFANLRNYSISKRLLSGYLQQPYQWFLMRNSSEILTSIFNEVSRSVNGVLYPFMRLISNGLIAILLFVLFILVEPIIAISTALILGISYGAIFKYAGKHIVRYGKLATKQEKEQLKAVNEALGAVKDVKISGFESYFIDKYQEPARKLALNNSFAKAWTEMPSFGMQALVFGGVIMIVLYLLKTTNGLLETIPVLALYALGGYKLMPALQEIYKQLAEIEFHKSALANVYKNITSIDTLDILYLSNNNVSPLGISNSFELTNIQFSYAGAKRFALNDISLKINKNSTVGFVGTSGSGKTTTVDIMLGLLIPSSGGLVVDNEIIDNNNIRSWQRSLGYVPQQIFLSDDSISANIAFGRPLHEIEFPAVEKAARTANLHDFIINELPNGYDTRVGERGARLSGGQRQRIGIARALYHDPDILILDEATSALDNITEKAVMDAVRDLGHKKTIIIIAHRLSTVQHCDKIFLFEMGKIISSGTYDELIKSSSKFREMALIET